MNSEKSTNRGRKWTSSNTQVLILVLVAACFILLLLNRFQNPQGLSYGLQSLAAGKQVCLTGTVRTSPTVISPGGTIGIFGIITNCSATKQRFTVSYTITDPSGKVTTIGSNRLDLAAGASIQLTMSYTVPTTYVPGSYTISLKGPNGVMATTLLTVQ